MTVRSDVVGSLLRPPELLAARRRLAAGQAGGGEFQAIEDRAVDEAIALQEQAGLQVVTDGELRRTSFQSGLVDSVDGFGEVPLEAYLWGEWQGAGPDSWAVERPAGLGVRSRLRRLRFSAAEEFAYLRGRTSRIPKVTLSSPGLYANLWSPEVSGGAYPTLDAFLADVVALLRDEVAELARLGATYVQLDAPHYALLLDPRTRAFYEDRGWPAECWLAQGVDLDNAVMAGYPAVTFGLHLCRGNQRSRWLVSGDYGPLAGLFRQTAAQRLLLEYDDDRSGSFEPLRQVPEDKLVVLGLVSTKSDRLESPDELRDRIHQAARCIDLERLALSPQCGFASSLLGNEIAPETQLAKLELVARTTAAMWG